MGGMNYIDCDVPAGMTLAGWRRSRRPAAPPRRRLRRLAPRLLRTSLRPASEAPDRTGH